MARVAQLFVLKDQARIMLHLAGWDWKLKQFQEFGGAILRIGDERLRCRHVGTANHNGTLVLAVVPDDCHPEALDRISRLAAETTDVEILVGPGTQ